MPPKKKTNLPSPPTDVEINGKPASVEVATKSTGKVNVSAQVWDPTDKQPVKLKIEYTANNWDTKHVVDSDFGKSGTRRMIHLTNLKVNHLYKLRLWTVAKKDGKDQISKQYTSVSFWTNRPAVIELITPTENSEYDEDDTILFDWKFLDPDDPTHQDQDAYSVRYSTPEGAWQYLPNTRSRVQEGKKGKNTYHSHPAVLLSPNQQYLWTARARDPQGRWSDWPLAKSFFVRGVTTPPLPVYPKGGIGTAVVASATARFSWKYRSRDPKTKQEQADLRYRVVGTETVGFGSGDEGFNPEPGGGDLGWTTLLGEGVIPGETMQWDIAPGHFQPGFLYEWQVRTYNDKDGGLPSNWSESAEFVAAVGPGSSNIEPPLLENTEPLGALGCGHHRVFVYDQGGKVLRGEIKPLARVQWGRKRDDIASCLIDTNGFDQDCGDLLGNLTSWAHEIVIFRDGVRVFEGPVTRITYTSENVEIEAKDVMAYLYRRVMRQGYNDAYRRIDLTPKTPPHPVGTPGGGPYEIIGTLSVVDRALQIALNALAYKDPNVLPYLTAIRYAKDAEQSRVVPDYAKSAWEEIDSLAATAGLDYTTIGRRIMFWDTHRTIGRLPEMRDGDFSDPVIVTEYGMQLSNWYAVTNNAGIAGIAYPIDHDRANWHEMYGPVEMVSSAYGEQEGAAVSTAALTPSEKDKLEQKLRGQAQKGIASRWPTPVVVRVPDNTTLNPTVNLGINQLVPGVWIPLRATLTPRKFAQWQKLDSVDVEEIEGNEFVRVTMSPAPHGGNDDPDLAGQDDAE